MKTCLFIALSLATPAAAEIPYPSALDRAAVHETQIADLDREALTLGNGDLNALLWERDGSLCLRVAKNDVWDARVDTSADPPLLQVDVANQKWTGGAGDVPSYGRPYPTPLCAAIVRIGAGKSPAWRCTRAVGKVNEWVRQSPDVGVMAIEGEAGASAGFLANLPATAGRFQRLQFKISGSTGAQYYVTLHSSAGVKESGWQNSPATEATISFEPPAGGRIQGVEIYILTKNGQRVENRLRDITLTGETDPLVLTPGLPPPRQLAAKLDLRRAVATVGDSPRARLGGPERPADRDGPGGFAGRNPKPAYLPAAELWRGRRRELAAHEDARRPGLRRAWNTPWPSRPTARARPSLWSPPVDTQRTRARRGRATRPRNRRGGFCRSWSPRTKPNGREYWSASGVRLDDPDFQAWWYRMVYMLRCFSKPGVVPAGLWAFQPTDAPNWHGDYHHNYNAWQPFWTPFIINHPDQAEPWVDYMNAMLPRLKWFAKNHLRLRGRVRRHLLLRLRAGPGAVPESEPTADRDPALRLHARHDRHVGAGALVPSPLPTRPRVLGAEDLSRRPRSRACSTARSPRNVRATPPARRSSARATARSTAGSACTTFPSTWPTRGSVSRPASRAAEELGRDQDLAARFRQALDLLPAYPTAPDAAGKPIVVDWTGCKFREIGEHNITVPAVPVFPGDQVTWFSPKPRRTCSATPCVRPVIAAATPP